MHIIYLSGGAYKQLWPLTNSTCSKQFLKILCNEGGFESLLERNIRQAEAAPRPPQSLIVAAEKQQRDLAGLNSPMYVHTVLQPSARGSLPAALLACAYIRDEEKSGDDDAIALIPAGIYADDNFYQALNEYEKLLTEKSFCRVLCAGSKNADSLKAPGILLFRMSAAQELFYNISDLNDFSFNVLSEHFGELPGGSFEDYIKGNIKTQDIIYEGLLYEIEDWEQLCSIAPKASEACVQAAAPAFIRSAEGTSVINNSSLPVAVIGLENAVVCATRDGILAADKNHSAELEQLLSAFNPRPMYEMKRWGEYFVLDHVVHDDGSEVLTKRLLLGKGKKLSYQYHNHRSEVWIITSGSGLLCLDDVTSTVQPGAVIQIGIGTKHSLSALTDLEFIEVQMGNPLIEEDIVRLDY